MRTNRRQGANLAHHGRSAMNVGRFRRRCHGDTSALADNLLQSIPLIRVEVAQLILDVNAVLAAQVEEILALHIQLARQDVDSHLIFVILQAEKLLCRQPPRPRAARFCTASSISLILTDPEFLKRDSSSAERFS
jgi:hypothetical protein